MRADRLGARGVTPALDRLGQAGTLFLDATAHAPLTLPSHTSILTGRFPSWHGVHDNAGFTLSASVPTLATILHGVGYHTAAFVSSYVLRRSTGLARGFDEYNDRFEGEGRAHLTLSSLERRGPETARDATAWLERTPHPYFLWVHLYDPHAPYDPPPAFASMFPDRPYDGEVATADFAVASIVGAIAPDRRGNTVIVITGDHGESLGEHGESEHGIFLYDATLHVPLILQGPGVPAGVRIAGQVRHVDLAPTLLDLTGVKVARPPFDGVSLVPLFGDRAGSERGQSGVRVGSEPGGGRSGDSPASYAESRFGELHFGWSPLRSLRDGEWKYIAAPKPELYQVRADPGERDDRHAARADTAAAMARVLAATSSNHGDVGDLQSTASAADAAERLRSLGYVSSRMTLDASASIGADPKEEIGRYEEYVKTFNSGLAALEERRRPEAVKTFRGLARTFPRAFEAHQYLARALAGTGDLLRATGEFDVAIALAPREAVLYFDAAKTLADAAQFDKAFARVAEGRRLEPASFEGALTEGLVARAAGQPTRAEQRFHEALRLNPSLAVAHFELGTLAAARGDRDAARTEFRLALDGDPAFDEARRALERLR